MIKIATHKAFKYGTVSLGVWIPPVFISDNNLQAKDEVDIFRTELEGKDALIIIPKDSNGKHTTDSTLKSQES